jgi:hypothetical protein
VGGDGRFVAKPTRRRLAAGSRLLINCGGDKPWIISLLFFAYLAGLMFEARKVSIQGIFHTVPAVF